ncbi:hypothetical protein SARC_10132 [Sphaeroforma arctica JP610]|uniref:Uncharacterized protein n=1 Tax=Sphaeroforma arctica JP610 TaxID=667725 RepID=A0A0L0FKU3_9EUKA|nr:hypothetical protein SARC_10132 [Sphaeroforma arctica JP610]KNC77407.1 hypothetical protein SARC_10132 [Sphaeroforma arctica JP610]|eukprot:XP_014151309.1 hypothetical protein SARC_10132 [Sphaeroforma arctica JP610]
MKEMLQQEFNVKKSDIPEGRWKVVDLVREMSTKAAHAAGGGGHLARFARSTRISFAEHHQRFLDECQAAFDKQNAALGNTDQLESDASSDDDDEDLANSLEGMMDGSQGPTTRAKILKITRTFVDEDGNMVKRTEVVRDLRVIEMYIAQEEENAPLPTDDAQNERGGTTGRGKRKRRTDDDGLGGGRAARGQGGMRGKKKCSACGQIGHVKSNKNKCPEWRDKNGDPHNYNLASPPGGRNDDVSEEETVKVCVDTCICT